MLLEGIWILVIIESDRQEVLVVKKAFVFVFACVMVLCLVGCGKGESPAENLSSHGVSSQEESQSENESVLLSVLADQTPFLTAKGTTTYLKDYKPIYKYPEDTDFYEKASVFVPRDYTFVDLDHDGNRELIVAEAPDADTYLILRRENDRVFGYSLYIRWFESLKQDGSFLGSSGALLHDYNTISFRDNTYTIATVAKFYYVADPDKPSSDEYRFEPDYAKSVFEIDGKPVSFDEIRQFAAEWERRPSAEWIPLAPTE